ncbi:AMP-binding protein [Mycolicibacterium vaccae]|uniref:Long-chain-fatty-acid--CoA ligase FadD13 n=1 Tax=Mycolicibacterium vaccae ATCC 25954 TaxID=1194972 RepID=K0V1W0_MYCVA|nr:AMP-binding protein [Mycolicibacterium vaccae]ANI41854.1 AMP-dependent synthetase and ligase [Mycolicibacterium vaccae 95051]EJZ08873.1 AMP-dependent synthetase and ligase [Mycolicibacterium vaccae ATCC 25954]
MSVLLADALRDAARDTPDRVLLRDGAVALSCAELLSSATGLAQVLLHRMPAGSVVSFMMPNWHEAAVVYLGATLAGMVVNPILPSLRDRELSFILADAGSRAVFIPHTFGGHDYAAMLDRVVAALPSPPEVVVVRGEPGRLSLGGLCAEERDRPLPAPDPAATRMIMYTSGTTGRPKGVLHSHESLGALIGQLGTHWRIDPGDTFLVPSPIAHIGGSIYAFECPLLLGTQAVLMDRWDPDAAVALMREHRCTHMAGATPFLNGLLAAARRADTRLPDLKVFICGGASVPPALIRSATDYFDKAAVSRVYGSTEVPVTTVGSLDDVDRAADTDGRPGIADVRLVDGEIRTRGPQMFTGYLHPQDGAESFDDAGYFRTGDLGRLTEDGHLVVTGRAKDLIIRNGENISPKEVEDILVTHPQIAEIAVVGVPDPRTGERACAAIVSAGPQSPGVAELRDFLVAHGVAKFKAPEQVLLVDTLPRNDAGKVLKHALRAVLVGNPREGET